LRPRRGGRAPCLLIDNPGEIFVDVATRKHGALRMETRTGDLRLWLFFAPTPAELLRDYTDLTGRMERPPLWALGFQQCRWSYMSADRVREIARGFRTRRIPCDVVYMDIDYMQDYLVFTWNTKTFSEPPALLKELKAEGFSPLCIIDPGVGIRPGYFAYDEGLKQQGFFCRHLNGELFTGRVWPGEVHMPDFTHPETRTTWANWQQTHLLDLGIAGVWNDMNEPAIFGDSSAARNSPRTWCTTISVYTGRTCGFTTPTGSAWRRRAARAS
jgi:alpha-glucosidase